MTRRRRRMVECLRPRPKEHGPRLTCFRCGLTRDLEDDGRRAYHAKLHVTNCPSAPTESAHQMVLVSSDHLQMNLEDGTTWFQIRRE